MCTWDAVGQGMSARHRAIRRSSTYMNKKSCAHWRNKMPCKPKSLSPRCTRRVAVVQEISPPRHLLPILRTSAVVNYMKRHAQSVCLLHATWQASSGHRLVLGLESCVLQQVVTRRCRAWPSLIAFARNTHETQVLIALILFLLLGMGYLSQGIVAKKQNRIT